MSSSFYQSQQQQQQQRYSGRPNLISSLLGPGSSSANGGSSVASSGQQSTIERRITGQNAIPPSGPLPSTTLTGGVSSITQSGQRESSGAGGNTEGRGEPPVYSDRAKRLGERLTALQRDILTQRKVTTQSTLGRVSETETRVETFLGQASSILEELSAKIDHFERLLIEAQQARKAADSRYEDSCETLRNNIACLIKTIATERRQQLERGIAAIDHAVACADLDRDVGKEGKDLEPEEKIRGDNHQSSEKGEEQKETDITKTPTERGRRRPIQELKQGLDLIVSTKRDLDVQSRSSCAQLEEDLSKESEALWEEIRALSDSRTKSLAANQQLIEQLESKIRERIQAEHETRSKCERTLVALMEETTASYLAAEEVVKARL